MFKFSKMNNITVTSYSFENKIKLREPPMEITLGFLYILLIGDAIKKKTINYYTQFTK